MGHGKHPVATRRWPPNVGRLRCSTHGAPSAETWRSPRCGKLGMHRVGTHQSSCLTFPQLDDDQNTMVRLAECLDERWPKPARKTTKTLKGDCNGRHRVCSHESPCGDDQAPQVVAEIFKGRRESAVSVRKTAAACTDPEGVLTARNAGANAAPKTCNTEKSSNTLEPVDVAVAANVCLELVVFFQSCRLRGLH